MEFNINKVVEKYLDYFPDEKEELTRLNSLIEKSDKKELYNSKNASGHITASGYIYNKKEDKMLLLEHRKLNKFLQPGGHVEMQDENTLETVIREIREETGLTNLEHISIDSDKRIPFDINTHFIPEHKKTNMSSHYHHDFRYLFVVNEINDIIIDKNESNEYKWIKVNEVANLDNFKRVVEKMRELI